MPKVITVDRQQILDVTRKLIEEERYDEINCRTIAKILGIGVGTLYHFFPTKMDIIASIIYKDWVNDMSEVNTSVTLEEGLKSIYNCIFKFSNRYYKFWHNTKDVSSEYIAHIDQHGILVKQICGLLVRLLNFNHKKIDDDLNVFVTEIIIYNASKLNEYERYGKYICKLLEGD